MGQQFDDMMNAFYHFDRENNADENSDFRHTSEIVSQQFQQKRQEMQRIMEETAESKRELTRYYNDRTDELLYQEQMVKERNNDHT
ncbi:hypothetical protein [Ligilactobacillus acidipiscis]|uniref:hypothetical protein n=1 Tax=Ligilactobacillus acidipiscis TaxID=89059 RepID=UPI0023F7295B|nr:hypothetical protein [Ligilactobacillus acidipiscis]WEV56433.1 hypothetical protein OZX66_09395 [Ligilactobacillus acidipiscis]